MAQPHVVVDGSNIATEGRSLPSLQQLDEAVRAFVAENPNAQITVVVDATFEHRIDASEKKLYDEANEAGELITPPAGTIGRGDKFLLEIADRADATVLSNDSFQEFHGEYDWLFDEGRLIGGKPVPGIGWIFTARTPVRGPKSRRAVRAASKASTRQPASAKKAASARPKKESRSRGRAASSTKAPDRGKSDAAEPDARKSTRKRTVKNPEPVNEPLPFIEFIAEHPVGSEVDGEVEEFSSHGAYVRVGAARCYVPLKAMADPAPRSAREVLNKGETRTFVVQSLDPTRRGIDLALPGFADIAPDEGGAGPDLVSEVEAAVEREAAEQQAAAGRSSRRRGGRSRSSAAARAKAADSDAAPDDDGAAATAAPTRTRSTRTRRAATQTAPVAEQATTADQVPAEAGAQLTEGDTTTNAPSAKKTAAKAAGKKAPAKKAPAKRAAPARKAPAKKAAPAKRAPAKKAPAKKATPAKRAPAKRAPAKKAPAKRAPAKKAPAKQAPAKKAPAKRAPAKRAPAKKAPAKRATARKAPAKKASPARSATKKR